MIFKWFLVFMGSLPLWGASRTSVVFLEVRNSSGQVIQLEPDFPLAHAVLEMPQGVLHAHPKTGVAWVSSADLHLFGEPQLKVSIPEEKVAVEAISRWLTRPYDHGFSWGDEKFYCSELIAKLLGIQPEPMHFDPVLWPPSYQSLEGLPGLSPGKLYRNLVEQGFSFKKD